MANPPRQKGTRAESAAARWLTDELGITVTRGPLRGNADRGDLFGIPDWTVEIKNTRIPNLKQWGRELAVEQRNAGCAHGVVLWSPPGVGMAHVGDWIALEWYYECFATQPGRAVPHIGTLNGLHRYVAKMQAWGYATAIEGARSQVIARLSSDWLYDVREQMTAHTA